MDEYISREETLKAFRLTAKNSNKDYQRGLQDAIDCLVPEVIAGIPSADVQSVVRCKDCKYAQNPNDTMVYCTYFECGTMSQDDFCSQGERRTENG